jgi:hypothetical protein
VADTPAGSSPVNEQLSPLAAGRAGRCTLTPPESRAGTVEIERNRSVEAGADQAQTLSASHPGRQAPSGKNRE